MAEGWQEPQALQAPSHDSGIHINARHHQAITELSLPRIERKRKVGGVALIEHCSVDRFLSVLVQK
jgi:hypothetical protein